MLQLNTSCTDCDISDDIIDRQLLTCFEESLSVVTYRARLEGTSETNSESLISLIEDWVSRGGTNIIVTGIVMTLDADCSIAISSLSQPIEPECSTTETMSDSIGTTKMADNTTIIIGGTAVIIVFIISVAIVIIALAGLVLKRRSLPQNTVER